jgi:Helix-turn-helix domain
MLRKESSVMDERLRFLARLLDGEPMTQVCRDFGISRKTGYKTFDRYKEHGLEALSDRSRRPVRLANQLPVQLEARIVAVKRDKPHWGPGRSASSWCATGDVLQPLDNPFGPRLSQLLDPSLRGKAIAVGGGVVLAASYEAKAFRDSWRDVWTAHAVSARAVCRRPFR